MKKCGKWIFYITIVICCNFLFINPTFSATDTTDSNATSPATSNVSSSNASNTANINNPNSPTTAETSNSNASDTANINNPSSPTTAETSNSNATSPATSNVSNQNNPATGGTGYPGNNNDQLQAQGVTITRQGVVKEKSVQAQPVLQPININSSIGTTPNYEYFESLRLAKYFTVNQSVEIYQQPKPIDAYVLDAQKIRYLQYSTPWNNKSDYRSQIKPIFTRSYTTQVTMGDPNNNEGQWRYTHDYRDIYDNQFPIYRANPQAGGFDIPYTWNNNYNHEQWDTNEILWMQTKKIPGIGWKETMNFGYKYATMDAKNDGGTDAYYQDQSTYFAYFSLAPSERCEWFGQFSYAKDHRPKSEFDYYPDEYLYAGELRMKSADLKTSIIPRVEWSEDLYYPYRNKYQKYEIDLRIGHDFTPKLRATDTIIYNASFRDEPDNIAPAYIQPPWFPATINNPQYDYSGWVGNNIDAQYNFYDKLWLQTGLYYSMAVNNMNDFDNWSFFAGLEYYAPGLIRVDIGYQGNDYYNLDKWLSSVGFHVYFFQ